MNTNLKRSMQFMVSLETTKVFGQDIDVISTALNPIGEEQCKSTEGNESKIQSQLLIVTATVTPGYDRAKFNDSRLNPVVWEWSLPSPPNRHIGSDNVLTSVYFSQHNQQVIANVDLLWIWY